jgi:branched-chain amino acid transport system permease protein
MDAKRYLPIAALIAAVIFIQLLTAAFDAAYYLTQLTMAAYYSLVAVGLCVFMGYAGQISLGQAGFFAIGGYATATLTTVNLAEYRGTGAVETLTRLKLLAAGQDLYGNETLAVAPWAAALAAVLLTVLVALLIGLPLLKLKGHYLAMATLGFGIIIYRTVLGTELFGEADGITGVPGFPLFFGLEAGSDFDARVENYYLAWSLVAVGMVLIVNLIRSRAGRALRYLHGSEAAAEAMGIDTARFKLAIFVLAAVYASTAGIFLTHYNAGIGPSEATVMKSVRYVAIVAVGGMANIWGALIMGTLLNFLSLRGIFGSYDDVVFGAILIGIMIFAPEGILKAPGVRDFLLETRKRLIRKFGRVPGKAGGSREGGRRGSS